MGFNSKKSYKSYSELTFYFKVSTKLDILVINHQYSSFKPISRHLIVFVTVAAVSASAFWVIYVNVPSGFVAFVIELFKLVLVA